MLNPIISVIIPVHDAAPYLRACVDSVLHQTFPSYEILLIDDASTDGSGALCEELAQQHEAIRVFHQNTNQGIGPARNRGMAASRGRYIAFLDDDDAYQPQLLAELCQAAERQQADVVTTIGFDNWQDGKITRRIWGVSTDKELLLPTKIEHRMQLWMEEKISWVVWNKLFRRDFLQEHQITFRPIPIADDKFFHFQCVCEVERYVQIPTVGNLYRIHPSASQFHREDEHFLTTAVRAMREEQEALDAYLADQPFFQSHNDLRERVRLLYARTSQDFFRSELGCTGEEFIGTGRYSRAVDAAWAGQRNGWYSSYLFKQAEYWRARALKGNGEEIRRYVFPYHLFRPGMRVALYGAGEVGISFYHQMQTHDFVTLAGIVDSQAERKTFPIPVQSVAALRTMTYDAVLITVRFRHYAEEIRETLHDLGVEDGKVCWDGDHYEEEDFLRGWYLPRLAEKAGQVLDKKKEK